MIYIGYGMFIFGLIRLVVSFINRVSALYLSNECLHDSRHAVSVLIPARNEEENIANLMNDLLSMEYQPLEILIYNDSSTDNTAAVVKKYTSSYDHVKLINGGNLPRGWLGKNHACHNLALKAKGSIFLFLDADVRIKKGTIEKSLAYIDRYKIKLLSVFPTQITPTPGSRLVVPIMNWILLSLLPLPLVRLSRRPSLSAANGQFMLFDANVYREILPHQRFRNSKAEDIAIVKEFKRRKLKCATLLGGKNIYCKMYTGLKEGIDGFSKNVFHFFGGSRFLTILFAVITTIAPLYLFAFNEPVFGLSYLLIVTLIHLLVSISAKQSVTSNLLLLVPQQYVLWRIIITAFIHSKNITWKGRNISTVS